MPKHRAMQTGIKETPEACRARLSSTPNPRSFFLFMVFCGFLRFFTTSKITKITKRTHFQKSKPLQTQGFLNILPLQTRKNEPISLDSCPTLYDYFMTFGRWTSGPGLIMIPPS